MKQRKREIERGGELREGEREGGREKGREREGKRNIMCSVS